MYYEFGVPKWWGIDHHVCLITAGLPNGLFVIGQLMLYRDFAPIAVATAINPGLTIAFAPLRDYWNREASCEKKGALAAPNTLM